MEQRTGLLLFLSFSSLILLSFSGSVDAYKNYTVGDSLGWYDTTVKSNVNYQKWAAGKNFSLGDFLNELPYRCRKDISLTDRLISYPVPSRHLILLFYLA